MRESVESELNLMQFRLDVSRIYHHEEARTYSMHNLHLGQLKSSQGEQEPLAGTLTAALVLLSRQLPQIKTGGMSRHAGSL